MSRIESIIPEFKKEDRVLVALSGGPDSMALLDLLRKKQNREGFDLLIGHVNHGIREQSNDEEIYLRNLAKEFGLPFYSKKLNLNKESSSEEQARTDRYQFLKECAHKERCNIIVTAHHLNDQAETVLLNLFRGAGAKGLAGISQESVSDKITLLRPLIEIPKEDILKYCKNNNLIYFQDHSNKETLYTRNYLRNNIIPQLENRFPGLQNRIAQTSQLIQAQNNFIQCFIDKLFSEWVNKRNGKIILNPNLFINEDKLLNETGLSYLNQNARDYLISELIRKSLLELGSEKNFTKRNIEQIVVFFKASQSGYLNLPNNLIAMISSGEYSILSKDNLKKSIQTYCLGNVKSKERKYYLSKDGLLLETAFGKLKDFSIPSKEENRVILVKDKLPDQLWLRPRKDGDRIKPRGMEHSKKLSRVLIDNKVPVLERNLVPILADENKIVWIPKLYFAEELKAGNLDEDVIEITLKNLFSENERST